MRELLQSGGGGGGGVRRGAKNEDAASGHPRPPYEMINFTHHLGNSQILSKLLKIIYFAVHSKQMARVLHTATNTHKES
jgi:hypothetical protein